MTEHTDSVNGDPFANVAVISTYSQAQAIEDGVLVRVPDELRQEAGFKAPVLVAERAYQDCVALPEGYEGAQDWTGRMWDVLWMAAFRAGLPNHRDKNMVSFSVMVRAVHDDGTEDKLMQEHSLWLHIGPGDNGEPVFTIMKPEDY